jgi:hypothetical protein
MSEQRVSTQQRLTRKQKNANDKQYFKDQLDSLDSLSFINGGIFTFGENATGMSEYRRMKINYDLFNNIVNKTDFEHVCSPFGKEVGELPADFTNKDIISGKVKALLGMEMKRPFSWKVAATNEEATTRIEQEEFKLLKDFVINSIMLPIRQQIEQQYLEQSQGKELSPDEQRKIQEQVEQEMQSMTPPEVKRYMSREHQDPAEALAHQILEYLIEKEDIKMKFNKAWKHGLISGREIFWVGIVNGEPCIRVVNPLRFDYDKSPDLDYIEDGEWAVYEMYMTPSEIVKSFGSELSDEDIDDIYEEYHNVASFSDDSFTFRNDGVSSINGVRVLHGEWKGLKPIKFIEGVDPVTGEFYEDIVDESYQLNGEAGDINERIEWIITKYEGYRIGRDKYAFLREVPGQYKDLTNLYHCKLSFIGAAYDNLNSEVTSLVDRMKYWQYFYNIISYRIELLTASDEGKKILLNLNLIPKGSGITLEKWMHYFSANKIGFLNPNEEGNRNADITQAAKEIDMSLASDIQKYIALAEYIERRCGESVGITKQIEGQIKEDEAVSNTRTAIIQSSNIIEPYYEVHNNIKRNALQALIECAKVAYAEFQPRYINYVLDDMSRRMVNIDYELLENSTYGIFVSNSMKSHEALQMVQQLSHAALQNQTAELSDVLKIMRSESVQEAEELLKVAEQDRKDREQQMQQQQLQAQAESEEKAREFKREEWQHEMNKMEREEELKTERELQKQAILSLGFNEDKDLDKDGMPDVLEVYKAGVDAQIKASKQKLDEDKLMHQKEVDKKKLEQKDKEIKIKQQQGNKVVKK